MEGYFSCKVRPMEGRLVLLERGDEEEMKDLVELAPEWLGQWFEDIKPWNPTIVARERFVWLRCQGVPAHAWGPESFATIGNVWGKFISTNDSTSKKKRFDIGKILISTLVMEFISKSMNIRVNDVPFFIKVMEEKATNGIFSMTSDHAFKESTDAKASNSKMWSLYSDIDGAIDESVQGGGCSRHSFKCADGKVEDDDKERKANVESKNEMVDDVESENGREREKSQLGSQGKKATARQKIFEFENVENSLISVEESIKQSDNECIAVGIGNTQGLLINTQGETAEEATKLGSRAAKKKKVGKVKSARVEREKTDDMCDKEGEKQRGDGSFVGVEIHSEEQAFWQGREECPGIETKQSKSKKAQEIEDRMPKFSLDPQNQAAEDSITDSGIENRNRCLGSEAKSGTGEQISGFAKIIRVVDRGNEDDVLRRLEAMEERDKETGVGKEGKKRGVRELVAREKVKFLIVQESKVKGVDTQLCRALWGSDNFEWVAQPSKGDANTKFFHRCVKGRRSRNDIVSIMVGSERLEEVKELKEGVARNFESLFQEEEWQRPVLNGIEFKKILAEEGSMLEAPFKEEEVKQAVWSCESSKAPGLDGFNFKFIKEM
ncbi:hypothetical protein SLEP1_g33387 [Rubroshorea leprosula]|uniref:DUF4283 domain-containing protein n=1 Tax=Rubroshorea leprosula TaxID=152421 RepID=A0AAV5KGF1_9ROSI|nr:hypothetical protein SLEP1_g33387 [Rubroshorea leprosula]